MTQTLEIIKKELKQAALRVKEIHFDKEYFDRNDLSACQVAFSKENEEKNRSNHWGFPYDHNLITSIPHYINASPMQFSSNSYIAAQGPRNNTMEDFWEMIVKEKSDVIVSVTNETELWNGKMAFKFNRFWPSITSLELKNLIIHPLEDQLVHEWGNVRAEQIRKRSFELEYGNQKHYVTHLHMENWPDSGVISPESLVELGKCVDTLNPQGPITVHCAAGVGRTGTFIGFHSLYHDMKQQLNDHKSVRFDVIDRVKEMRKLRWGPIVAVEEQFYLLIDALEIAINKLI